MSKGPPLAGPGRRSGAALRLHGRIFTILFLVFVALSAWLSTRYVVQLDLTDQGRNSLSGASLRLLESLSEPVRITAFAPDDRLVRGAATALVDRYQRHTRNIVLAFVDPYFEPDRARRAGISERGGELLLEYGGRSERVERLNEVALSSALARLLRSGQRWAAYLTGHGERDLRGRANHDLGLFGEALASRGFTLQAIEPASVTGVPDNVDILILTQPRVALSAGEVATITAYVDAGGSLLWIADPGALLGLEPIAERLGTDFLDGTIVDPSSAGIAEPYRGFTRTSRYPAHAATDALDLTTLFPLASALRWAARDGWSGVPILLTGAGAWSETGALTPGVSLDADVDEPGPLAFGYALHRPHPRDDALEQRAVIVGDGDFLANAYLGNGGNLALGLKLVDWLTRDDALIQIPQVTAADLAFELSRPAGAVIALGSLIGLPAVLLMCGGFVWLRRRRR